MKKEPLHRNPRAAVEYARNNLSNKTAAEIFSHLYEVACPNELIAIFDITWDSLDLDLEPSISPWNPMLAGDKALLADNLYIYTLEEEDKALSYFPNFIPLCLLAEGDAVHGDMLIGYDLDRLRENDTRIRGFNESFSPDDKGKILGESLSSVLLEWAEDILRMVVYRVNRPYGDSFSGLDHNDIAEYELMVERIKALMR